MNHSYRDLIAWQKAMDLVVAVYSVTREFPRDETYGLSNQLRRAVVSIPSNIAEGQGRKSIYEFSRFLNIAYGSLQETETQLMIAQRLGYLQEPCLHDLLTLCAEVGRLVNGLVQALERRM